MSGTALLDFARSNTYPQAEDVEADLLPSSYEPLRVELAAAKNASEDELRRLSKETGPEVDDWIKQAQQLQLDIQRSKDIAREVVEEAEQAEQLRADRDEIQQKLDLLEVEVTFNQRLQASLQQAQDVSTKLASGHEALKEEQLSQTLENLEVTETSLVELRPLQGTNGVEILQARTSALRAQLQEQATAHWDELVVVNQHGHTLSFLAKEEISNVGNLLSRLNLLEGKLQKLSRDIDRCLLAPRLNTRRGHGSKHGGLLRFDGNTCRYDRSGGPANALNLMDELSSLVDFLHACLPQELSILISEDLMPSLMTRLVSEWLHDALPPTVEGLVGDDSLETILRRATGFEEHLANIGWHGGAELNDWVEQAPKNYLAKRRESCLIQVRDLLSEKISQTREVERIETQMVSKGDVMGPSSSEDDWGADWEEEAQESSDASRAKHNEEEDVSAWDADEATTTVTHVNGDARQEAGEEDAWGWDEPDSPTTTKKPEPVTSAAPRVNGIHDVAQQSGQRELTLKERHTITAVPDALMELIKSLISDASSLQSQPYSSSTVAPAANALYTLPTLIVAGYRALAPTFYSRHDSGAGNMYLYNDCTRLVSSLTSFASELEESNATAARRAKLADDISSTTSFAARAYGTEMSAQRTILCDLLDGAQGFANCTEQPYARECENAVDMTIDRVKEVAKLWKGVLSESALLQSLGSLLGGVVEKVILDILDLSDISEPESVQLKKMMDKVSALSELFVQSGDAGMGGASGEEQGKRDMTGIYTSSWFRFQYLGEILESNLADIKYLWQEGELRLEFSADEVAELIEALFSDSDRRRGTISEIRRG